MLEIVQDCAPVRTRGSGRRRSLLEMSAPFSPLVVHGCDQEEAQFLHFWHVLFNVAFHHCVEKFARVYASDGRPISSSLDELQNRSKWTINEVHLLVPHQSVLEPLRKKKKNLRAREIFGTFSNLFSLTSCKNAKSQFTKKVATQLPQTKF
jgi:hypothetical protein